MKEMKLIGVIGLILVIITHMTLAVLYTTGTDTQYGVLTTTAGILAALGWIMGLLLLLSEKEEIRKIDSTEKWY